MLTAIPDKSSFCVNVFLLERTCILDSIQVNRNGTYMLAGKITHCCRKQSRQITHLLYISRPILLRAGSSDSKEAACSTGDLGSIHGREDPWKRACQPTLVFLLRDPHGQRSLEGYSPRDHQSMVL